LSLIQCLFPDLGAAGHFFETMHPAILKEAHNEIRFYVPEGADVNLSVGATHASLQDAWAPGKEGKEGILGLQAGDILVFKEVRNPETGSDTTADPTHRHAVRLTRVFAHSQAGKPLVDIGIRRMPYPSRWCLNGTQRKRSIQTSALLVEISSWQITVERCVSHWRWSNQGNAMRPA
jgi:hypothetical protein